MFGQRIDGTEVCARLRSAIQEIQSLYKPRFKPENEVLGHFTAEQTKES